MVYLVMFREAAEECSPYIQYRADEGKFVLLGHFSHPITKRPEPVNRDPK